MSCSNPIDDPMRPFVLLLGLVASAACGRSELMFAGGADDTTTTTSPPPPVTTGPVPGSGDEGDDVDDPMPDDQGTGEPEVCTRGPDIRWRRLYDGEGQGTIAHDLVRAPDGTLYLAGAREDASTVSMWIAAADPEGTLLWETTALPKPGNNLAAAPVVYSLVQSGEILLFSGVDNGSPTTAWHGQVTTDGDIIDAEAVEEAIWFGATVDEDPTRYLVGRSLQPGGALIARYDGAEPTYVVSTDEQQQWDDVALAAAVDEGLFVSGSRDGLPWLARFDPATGVPQWSYVLTLDGVDFPPEGGDLQSLVSTGAWLVAGGDVRQDKPNPDGGHVIYNEPYLGAWSPEGEQLWWWQREPDDIRPGRLDAVTVGPDGMIYATGIEDELSEDSTLLVAAWSPDGVLRWSVDRRTHPDDPDLIWVSGKGLALAEPGALVVFADSYAETQDLTVLLEICY